MIPMYVLLQLGLELSQRLRTSEAGALSILVLQYASESWDFVHFNSGDWQRSDNLIWIVVQLWIHKTSCGALFSHVFCGHANVLGDDCLTCVIDVRSQSQKRCPK